MQDNFLKAMSVTLQYEGGYSNDRRDPGGVTLNGIIQRVDDAWRRNHGQRPRPLTPAMNGTAEWNAERNAIYKAQYWDAIRGDELPAGLDLVVFDGAVNSGPYQSIVWLQRALAARGLYHIAIDGHFGEGTRSAIDDCDDYDLLIADICARRLGMLQHLSTWSAFGKGWSRRVTSVKGIGQAWATGSVGPNPVAAHEDGGHAKAYASDVAQPLFDAHQAGTGAVSGASIAGLVQGAQDKLAPLLGTSDFIGKIYVGLTIAGVAVTVGGVAYSFYAARKTAQARRAIDGDVTAEVPEGQPA